MSERRLELSFEALTHCLDVLFSCRRPLKYVTKFSVKVGCWRRRTEKWNSALEGTAEPRSPVSHFQAIGSEREKRSALLKKPSPSQPRGSSGLRSGQVPMKQPNVCKTSSRMKRLSLQRQPQGCDSLGRGYGTWGQEADLLGKSMVPSAHRLGCRVPSKEGLTGWDNCPVFIFEKGYYTSRIIPSSLLLG